MQQENIVLLKMELITPNPNQPRKIFDDTSLNELAASIKKYGILNPILVRKKENLYEIIAGERRYRAAKIAGLTEMPVIIKDVDDRSVSELALIENIQRENITPMEEAITYEKILKNSNITEEKLSEYIGKSQPFISNKLRLLKLPIEVQTALNNKKISEKHARTLLTISDNNKQLQLLEKIIKERLSVKELEYMIKKEKEEKESDNMNNGSFFPNYNNQDNNNMSLNQMNMQTMSAPNQPSVDPIIAPLNEQTINVPTTNEPAQTINPQMESSQVVPQVEIQNMDPIQPMQNITPEPIMPELNNTPVSPIPDFGVNMAATAPVVEKPAPVEPTPASTIQQAPTMNTIPSVDIPLFNENAQMTPNVEPPVVEQPIAEPTVSVEQPQAAPETPLFNNNLNAATPEPNLNESFYEVPVNVSPIIEEPQTDNFSRVQQLLSSNNIEYKAYSNESGHCIIIEL